MEKQIYNLRNGYTIDEVEDVECGRLIKLTIHQHAPAVNAPVVRSKRFLALVVSVVALATAATLALTLSGKTTREMEPPKVVPETAEPSVVVEAEQIASALAECTDCPLTVSTFYDVPLSLELQAHIINECGGYGIDPAIVFAMIERESSFRDYVIGDNGQSYGLMQIKKNRHLDRMERLGVTDLLNPFQNVMVGIDYLAYQLDRYDGDMAKALVGYNKGHFAGTVTEYATDVLEKAEKWRNG